MPITEYRSYTHIERLGRDGIDAVLSHDKVVIMPKLDGTNSLIWAVDGKIHAGSRKREIDAENDNADFYKYITTSDDDEVAALRQYCVDHPERIVYGEYLGNPETGRLLGAIKTYDRRGFFVFDVFDVSVGTYLDYEEYYPEVSAFYSRTIPAIAILNHPTVEEVSEYSDKGTYNLLEGGTPEGIVIKANPSHRDVFGNVQMAKIVLAEYKDKRHRRKERFPDTTDYELEFVSRFCTEALFAKELNKVLVALGMDHYEQNGKVIGMFLCKVIDSLMEEEFWGFFKRHLSRPVDVARIKALSQSKAREFIGL